MQLLLDTVTLLWLAAGDPQLSTAAGEAIANPDHEVFLSPVSAWEIAVKFELGKLPLPERPELLVPRIREAYQIASLPIDEESALKVHTLPGHHRDPFDRMLICQAITHGLAIVTPDDLIRRYPVRTFW